MIAALAAITGLSACTGDEPASQQMTANELQASLDQLQSKRPDVAGFSVAIMLGDGSLLSAATGHADPQERVMTADTPVRIASITKTFVAASILRLWEDGLIDLDAPIPGLISTAHNDALSADGYQTDAITVRHLLMHASGMNDHFAGDAFKGMVLADPSREWSRTEQIMVMVETTDPVGAPGEKFSYSDTGYILLGEIMERITGEPLGAAVKRLTKFEEIGIDNAWWDAEDAPSPDAPERAHQWLGDVDTFGLHGSVDAYGGGGIVANVGDVARFYAALFGGAIFEKPQTLALMIEAPDHPDGSPYRMGLFADELNGHKKFGHGGFWGTDVFILPEVDVIVSGAALNAGGIDDLRDFEAALVETVLAK
ncbi:MAG: serine hydrolase domain-containing protein [Pseudomonadota bacterium]